MYETRYTGDKLFTQKFAEAPKNIFPFFCGFYSLILIELSQFALGEITL